MLFSVVSHQTHKKKDVKQNNENRYNGIPHPHLLFPDELASFKRTGGCKNFLKEEVSNLWVNVSHIPALAHRQKYKPIKHMHEKMECTYLEYELHMLDTHQITEK